MSAESASLGNKFNKVCVHKLVVSTKHSEGQWAPWQSQSKQETFRSTNINVVPHFIRLPSAVAFEAGLLEAHAAYIYGPMQDGYGFWCIGD